ncbi:hypothetical protein BH10PLA2_BH10PLA2_26110 [soil metagenome]
MHTLDDLHAPVSPTRKRWTSTRRIANTTLVRLCNQGPARSLVSIVPCERGGLTTLALPTDKSIEKQNLFFSLAIFASYVFVPLFFLSRASDLPA